MSELLSSALARIHRETEKCPASGALLRAAPGVKSETLPLCRSGVDGNDLVGSTLKKRKTTMANALGYVSETGTGFEGTLALMNLSAPIKIERNVDKAVDSQPDYRIFAGDILTEIGGGWIVIAKSSGKEYISLTIADPQIGPRRIYANLAPVKGKKGRFVLLWNPKD